MGAVTLSVTALSLSGLKAPVQGQRSPEWIKAWDSPICCLQQTHFKHMWIRSKGMKTGTPHRHHSKENRSSYIHFRQNGLQSKESCQRSRGTLHSDKSLSSLKIPKNPNAFPQMLGLIRGPGIIEFSPNPLCWAMETETHGGQVSLWRSHDVSVGKAETWTLVFGHSFRSFKKFYLVASLCKWGTHTYVYWALINLAAYEGANFGLREEREEAAMYGCLAKFYISV